MNELTEYTLTKFMYDPNLGEPVNTMEGRAAIQRDLTGKKEQANREPMKFIKDKCKIMHLRWISLLE